ncbi:MAG TPA: hypothetical protein VN797_00480, partial [Gemmatimonadaceae bacterium]|nr:hypothetical protein [Gemmatimonadaceae bacterium]
ESFARLSTALITTAKAANAPLGDDMAVMFCPMLRKYWIQKGPKVQNPYYGKAMLECGRAVTELPTLD